MELFNTKQVARILGVSEAWLERDRWAGAKIPLHNTTWKVIGYSIDPLKNISLLNQLLAKKTLKDSSANLFRTFNGLRLTFQVVSLYHGADQGPDPGVAQAGRAASGG